MYAYISETKLLLHELSGWFCWVNAVPNCVFLRKSDNNIEDINDTANH